MADNHDHSSATHSMACPVDGCNHVIEVHAHGEEEALHALMEAGKAHFEEMHPDAKGMSLKEMEKMTRENMKEESKGE